MTKVDAKIIDTREGGDLSLKGNDVELTGGWFNFVYLALFGGNVEQQTPQERNPEELAEDFWGNSLFHSETPVLQFNSRTEKVLNETQLNSQGRAKIEDAVKSDLEFMSQFANIGVSVNIESFSRVQVEISIQEPGNLEDKQFRFIWDQAKRELEGVSDEKEPEKEYQDYQVPGGTTGSGVSLSGYQTYTLTFEANSSKYNAVTIDQQGVIQQIDAPSGTTVYKLTSSSPYQTQIATGDSVSENDKVTVELNSVPSSKVTVEIVVSYSDVSVSRTLPEDLGGSSRYYYIVNHSDATVSCVDVVNGTEIATISMPANYTVDDVAVKCVYRYYEKEVFVIYRVNDTNYIIIDADPSSSNFNTIKSGPVLFSASFPADGQRIGYVQTGDYFVICEMNRYWVFDKNQIYLSWNDQVFPNNWGGNSVNNSFILGSYLFGGNSNGPRQIIDATKTGYNFIKHYGNGKIGAARYNPINGLIYWVEGGVRVVEVETWTVIAILLAGTDRGSCDIDLDNNIVLAVDSSPNGTVTKIDADTNTVIGSENQGEAMDQIFWSRASGYFYSRKRGTDQLFVFDPTKSPGSMKVNQITVGTTPVSNYRNNPCACINQIML